METYLNIRYEFDRNQVHDSIAASLPLVGSDYICVADGVILDNFGRGDKERRYLQLIQVIQLY